MEIDPKQLKVWTGSRWATTLDIIEENERLREANAVMMETLTWCKTRFEVWCHNIDGLGLKFVETAIDKANAALNKKST